MDTIVDMNKSSTQMNLKCIKHPNITTKLVGTTLPARGQQSANQSLERIKCHLLEVNGYDRTVQ